ncbi:uncharacterized protein [Malus domestica]|uniref:uncharacterized protein n=1 Tax=Malus domestica TaxID=3750 RepID=UPI000498B067
MLSSLWVETRETRKFKGALSDLMKIISWNVRGLGSRQKWLILKQQFQCLKPDIIILHETKKASIDRRLMASVWGSKFKEWIYAPAQGRFGGIAVIWNTKHISVIESLVGAFSVSIKIKALNGLEWWLSGGDFNVMRFVNEKSNGGRMTTSMRDFNDFIQDTKLKDLELLNAQFTRSNFREEPVCRKLDKFLFSVGCEEIFPEVEGYKFLSKLKTIKRKLQRWSKEIFDDIEKDIKEAEASIEDLDRREGMEGLDVVAKRKREELLFLVEDLAYKEEVKWR